jgi:hypothetical protein
LPSPRFTSTGPPRPGHAFFDLDRGLQVGRPPAIAHDAALGLVNRQHRIVFHDVVDIALEERVRVPRVLDRGQEREICRLEKIAA